MDVVEVKTTPALKITTGTKKDGKPWKKTFFVGVMPNQSERGISTFGHVEAGKTYEMELSSREYQGKIYWNANIGEEFIVSDIPKESGRIEKPETPKETTKDLNFVTIKEHALKCALIFINKSNTHVSTKDVLGTAQVFYDWLIE